MLCKMKRSAAVTALSCSRFVSMHSWYACTVQHCSIFITIAITITVIIMITMISVVILIVLTELL